MRTVILPLDSNIDNAHPKHRFFYRAYATNPVSIRISSFCLTKIQGLSAKAALFVYLYVCLCCSLQLRVFCLKHPFYIASVFAYKRENQFILRVPCHLNHVHRSRLLRCSYYNFWRFKA